MKAVVLVVILSVVSGAWANQCYHDDDCPDRCCAHSIAGHECKVMGRPGDICDLEGEHMADGVCRCEPGLVCQKIDLTEVSPIAASANPILEKYHYGVCVGDLVVG